MAPAARVGAVVEAERAEKITINLGIVDLGRIDLLVAEGFYTNRTDFIRSAIRSHLDARNDAINQTVKRRTLVLGTEHYSRNRLEELRARGEVVDIRVLGLATIADDVSPELALATIASVEVLGAFRARPQLKKALASRIT
jgi:Arc/MetJ-type ribon-helix-helix transcriptional regulator